MNLNVTPTRLPEVLLIQPRVFGDPRGFFKETFHAETYRAAGIPLPFVQDNLSRSTQGTLRGLHYQLPHAQGKLLTLVQGTIFDVAVDIRLGSPRFGQWVGVELSADRHEQLYVPPGFAHGFIVTSDHADVAYKCTDLYHPESDRGVLWSDPAIGIDWPDTQPLLSEKDKSLPTLASIPEAHLPTYIS